MDSNTTRLIFQVSVGIYPKTQVLHEAKTREDAAEWVKNNVPGIGAKLAPLHYIWLQGAWRRVNPNPISSNYADYEKYSLSTLRSGGGVS